ncbi:hypothetical protein KSP40_PGU008952 [Platanthera guangdongensis]|uniref:Secreted protein n=1 Tax=Platanthera guangdongensis TaxID=2320717 RepID=A0ABR2LXU5_9ASPA
MARSNFWLPASSLLFLLFLLHRSSVAAQNSSASLWKTLKGAGSQQYKNACLRSRFVFTTLFLFAKLLIVSPPVSCSYPQEFLLSSLPAHKVSCSPAELQEEPMFTAPARKSSST